MTPTILKAKNIGGANLVLRNAAIADAEFILSLRTDPKKSQHLSLVSPELNAQVKWLEGYASKTDEAYFIIENKAGDALGTVRLYDAQDRSFSWGSWIVMAGAPSSVAIESALIVYAFGLDFLGFDSSHFEVRKGNEAVWRFHERFGAKRIGETDQAFLFTLSREQIEISRQRYKKYLPGKLTVEWLHDPLS